MTVRVVMPTTPACTLKNSPGYQCRQMQKSQLVKRNIITIRDKLKHDAIRMIIIK